MGVVRVLTQSAEHIRIIAPKGDVRDVVVPAKCDFIGLLMLVYLPCSAEEVAQMLGASCLHQGLGSAVCEQGRDKTCIAVFDRLMTIRP